MKDKKSTSKEDMKNLIDENHDFLSALNKGASSNELNEIKSRLKSVKSNKMRHLDLPSSDRSPDEAA